jgi:hypothetical protein
MAREEGSRPVFPAPSLLSDFRRIPSTCTFREPSVAATRGITMKIHLALVPAAIALSLGVQAEEAFTYHCTGGSRILPSGLALGKADWKFDIDPDKQRAGSPDKWMPMEINQYRVSFLLEGKHGISITRSNGHFYAIKPVDDPEKKMQEYLLYEGTCTVTK